MVDKDLVDKFIRASNEIYKNINDKGSWIYTSKRVLCGLLSEKDYKEVCSNLDAYGKADVMLSDGEVITIYNIEED